MIDVAELTNTVIDVKEQVKLKNKTWLGVGGAAEFYTEPKDTAELKQILKWAKASSLPVTILGAGSNILIRDGGIEGLVIKLGKSFQSIRVEKNTLVCGAGSLLMNISKVAAEHNLSGFEFMVGIPGSLGGGFKTNAGAYGSDLAAVTIEMRVLDSHGTEHVIDPHQKKMFSYRHCHAPTDWIFVEATLKGKFQNDNVGILKTMKEYTDKRKESQPQHVRTAGSTFKNPEGYSAWKLLDKAGFRGYTKNGAQFSEKHPNFLVNTGTANAKDLENLICEAQGKVYENTGIKLDCEIRFLGKDKA